MARIYRTNENSNWRNKLSRMIGSGKPIYFIKIETTGLDPKKDDIVAIRAIKTIWSDGILKADSEYRKLIKSDKLTDEISKINGVTKAALEKNGVNLKEAYEGLAEFLEKDANIVSYSISAFLGPFLSESMVKSGVVLSIKNTLDLFQMSVSLVSVSKYSKSYSHKKLADALKVTEKDTLYSYIEMFNKMFRLVPNGQIIPGKNFMKKAEKWSNKGEKVSYIYFTTSSFGQVRLNMNTLFFEEDALTPGFFDVIDMDAFTSYISRKRKVSSLRDFINLYK